MKIAKTNISSLGLVYDGEEDGYYEFILKLQLESKLETLTEKPFKFPYFSSLLKILDKNEYQDLISSLPAAKPSKLIEDMYLGTNGFPLTYTIHNTMIGKKFIIIVSSGEFQPGRYKIFLEGVFEIFE